MTNQLELHSQTKETKRQLRLLHKWGHTPSKNADIRPMIGSAWIHRDGDYDWLISTDSIKLFAIRLETTNTSLMLNRESPRSTLLRFDFTDIKKASAKPLGEPVIIPAIENPIAPPDRIADIFTQGKNAITESLREEQTTYTETTAFPTMTRDEQAKKTLESRLKLNNQRIWATVCAARDIKPHLSLASLTEPRTRSISRLTFVDRCPDYTARGYKIEDLANCHLAEEHIEDFLAVSNSKTAVITNADHKATGMWSIAPSEYYLRMFGVIMPFRAG